mmetsp:Transcript_33514/g.80947  ORF Transcript_33514/g.80947 Transcript_33514/m.80947 type:complete len:311 (-) Transcript_33514:117-1049(-)
MVPAEGTLRDHQRAAAGWVAGHCPGWVVRPVSADGACFFRAVSVHLNDNEDPPGPAAMGPAAMRAMVGLPAPQWAEYEHIVLLSRTLRCRWCFYPWTMDDGSTRLSWQSRLLIPESLTTAEANFPVKGFVWYVRSTGGVHFDPVVRAEPGRLGRVVCMAPVPETQLGDGGDLVEMDRVPGGASAISLQVPDDLRLASQHEIIRLGRRHTWGLTCTSCFSMVYSQSRVKHWMRKECVKTETEHKVEVKYEKGDAVLACWVCGASRAIRPDRTTAMKDFLRSTCKTLPERSRQQAVTRRAKRRKLEDGMSVE